ncbi:hypothetical protein [Methylophaga sp. OBS3]|jgi:hypothetical protein|uniref:hypothetical protein n=1 Tax=Methylophaga sp. OBS3 TaxID=2991934 RepID=UPI00224FE648|nr:hypothetical protein [Methylophaga sp. OBS3]MCX4189903.1 hypothetical protein [Methylophaga sp. OBS3]
MFFIMLIVTFLLAFGVSFIVVSLFKTPLADIFQRIIKDPISIAWQKYIVFATYVVGISGGVRIYQLERYITAQYEGAEELALTTERWVIEIYRTLIETLQSIAWLYLVVFVFALIAYVIVRGFELKHARD